MKLVWISDIHLNFLNREKREEFYQSLKGDCIVISGDIAESHNVVPLIQAMKEATKLPVYFVLGNHDFYGSSVASVRRLVKRLRGYLGSKEIVALGASTALVGVDGWGDCRYGDYEGSCLTMSDWWYIDDLRKGYGQGPEALKKAIQKLADSDAKKLKRKVEKAIFKGYSKIIIVTHVPPFEEACWKSTPDGLPFFASKILGETIRPLAVKNPKVDFLWLSGHTHNRAKYKPCNNMTVKVAKAEYYRPQIEDVIEYD